MQTIGSVLKSLREAKKMLLQDVVDKTGINKTLLSRMENDKRLPTKDQVTLLCSFYQAQKNDRIIQWLSDRIANQVQDEGLVPRVAGEKIRRTATRPAVRNAKAGDDNKKIAAFVNRVIQGDCLDVMRGMPDHSVDMILCDLPYGTTQNKWDSVIDLPKLWAEYERIIKDNGCLALTAQGVFTARLILSNEKLFKYKIIWIKSKPTNFLNVRKQPLRKHEDICIFYKKQPVYHPQMTSGEPYDKGLRKDQYTGSYGDFKPHHVKSAGGRYPNDVIACAEQDADDFVYIKTAESEGKVLHPTQKPVELGRYLIRTYTSPGDLVLDNACGSGSFLLAAVLENRRFVGIEKNEDVLLHKAHPVDYIKICRDRIRQAELLVRRNGEARSIKS